MVPIEPVWYAVLRRYRELEGVGLSGNLLCHLTQMDWPEMKEQIKAYYEDRFEQDPKTKKQVRYMRGVGLYTDYCYTEMAHLLIWAATKPEGYPVRYENIENQIREFPWQEYPSFHRRVGQTRINLCHGEPTYRELQAVVRSYGIEPGDAPYGLAATA